MEDQNKLENPKKFGKIFTDLREISKRNIFFRFFALLFIIFCFVVFGAPREFPAGSVVDIKSGSSLRAISLYLQNKDIIRSRIAFESLAILYGGERRLVSGAYLFEERSSVFEVAKRISKGDRHLTTLRITIPEGFGRVQMADLFAGKLINFDKELFLLMTKDMEGYLFPDTYFFFNIDDESAVVNLMSQNFKNKIAKLESEIASYGRTEKEIITMASIIEREASGEEDKEFISGILWKRLRLGIALQVDAAPDTYKERGLPDRPIASPGMSSIKAAINPKDSPYLYYLHDKLGQIHYAKNFNEHRANIDKYLR